MYFVQNLKLTHWIREMPVHGNANCDTCHYEFIDAIKCHYNTSILETVMYFPPLFSYIFNHLHMAQLITIFNQRTYYGPAPDQRQKQWNL